MTTRRDMGTSPAPGRVLGHAWAVRVAMVDGLWCWWASTTHPASARYLRGLWISRTEAGRVAKAHRDLGHQTRLVQVTFRGPR